MSKTKTTPISERSQGQRVKRVEPTPADLERAARSLHTQLAWLVKELDQAEAAGAAVGETWPKIQRWQRKPAAPGVSTLTGTELALRAYAERTVLEDRRRMLGGVIGETALKLVRGEITAANALTEVREWRARDGWLSHEDESGMRVQRNLLTGVISKSKTELSRWKAAYNYLAEGADVVPVPDTARGSRGPLGAMYLAMSKRERD